MSINIRQLNDGQPRQNPYGVGSGVVSQIPPSFSNVEYYDCYIPYALTNAQLGGYKETETIDPTPGQEATYPPMSDAIKQMRVANFINLEERYNYPSNIQSAIDSGRITRSYDSSMHCYYLTKDGIKFYEMAVQPFFLRRSIGTGDPSSSDGFFPYTMENRGQLVDVILTSGKCVHFVLADINSTYHTNCGSASHDNAHDGFAATSYHQYHNIISAISGNTIEILGEGSSWQDVEDYASRKFARAFNLGVWGINGSEDIALYRVYNHRIQDTTSLSVTEERMKSISYDISEQQPPTPTRTKTCFIGDSRANMLKQALEADGTIDTSNYSFIVQGGMGYEWLVDTAIPSFNSQSSDIKNCIIFQLGVNNINTSDAVVSQRANQYISTYNELANNNPDINFYFCTVGPVDETKDAYVTDHNRNEWIIQFNSAVSAGLNNKWTTIDLYTYLVQDGFKPTSEDGLHYANSVTMKMYNYVMNIVDSGETPTPPSTYTVSVSNDGHGTASASPTSGSSGTQVTLTATPNSGYSFSKWEVISGGVTITNNKFTIGSSNVSVKAVFKKMGYSIPQVPYFCQWAGLIDYQSMTISNSSEINISLGTNGEIVRDSGCGPSCASMALSYILGKKILISTLISKMGGYQSFMVDGVGDWGLGITLANAYGVQAKRTNSHTEALNALKQGNIVMAITGDATVGQLPSGNTKWSRGGHYILLVGATSDNKIAVNDPGEPRNTYWYRGANYGDWSETWREKQTVDWSQITPAVRAPGNSNSDSDKIAGSGAYTIFYVPEDKKSGEYEPTEESPYLELPVKEEKGIFGLKVDFDVWKAGTHLIRIGDSVKLKATYDSVAKRVTWADITNPTKPVYYTPSELKKHFGISYTKVNNGYVGRFYVDQEPLAPKYGGTGVASILDLMYAMFGTDSYAGGYDFSLTNSSNVSNALLPNSANKITLPSVSRGHIITVEAISDTRNGGSLDIGDQAQTVSPSLKIDVSGEVAFVYDKDVKNATALYRLESPGDPLQSAEYKRMALCAANHACFLAQNANVGYNFYINGQEELWEYIKSQKGNITFGNVEFKANTNCINLCKLIYASVMYNSTNKKYFDALWTTEGILSGNTLENIGFTRHNASYAQNPINLEIGDILVFKQSKSGGGHASIVVASGTKSWELNGTNYNPKKGEVKT